MSELKPCPFCGGKARLNEYKDCEIWYEVWCDGCAVRTEQYENEDEAVKVWNHRVERTAKVVPMVKEILGGTETITITSCELCKRDVTMWDRFCPNCGAKLEWGE